MLTLTEFDAIAVSQSTSYPAISLPLGANSLPLEVCSLICYEDIFDLDMTHMLLLKLKFCV